MLCLKQVNLFDTCGDAQDAVLATPDHKYVKIIYNLMLLDINRLPNKVNWASLLRDLFMSLDFNNVWLQQGVGDFNGFMSVLKQRLTDNFVQNWSARLENSSHALFCRSFASFRFQPYLEFINIQTKTPPRSISHLHLVK